MLTCPDEIVLEQFASGLSTDAAISCHVEDCPACRSRLEELREEAALLGRIRCAAGSSMSWRSARPSVASRELPEINGFDVSRLIAEGGMGRVYEAEQLHPRRRVAIKLLRAERSKAAHRQRLFRREADALARLRHPDIAAVYCAGATRTGEPFLAMELVHGEALDDYVADRSISPADVLRLMSRICRAVEHAHERGVIHRDLKPSNIMVDETGNPKVLDFGLARIADPAGVGEAGAASLTIDGRIAGTLAYMSPEQICGKAGGVDARSDVYSLGVILYELLAGELPIPVGERGFAEIVDAIRTETPAPLSARRPGLDPEVDRIVMRALQKAPADRYLGARDLADDIDRRLAGAPLAPAPAARPLRRRAAAVALALLVCALTVSLIMWRAGAAAAPDGLAASVQPVNMQDAASDQTIHRLAPMITVFGELPEVEASLRTRLNGMRASTKKSNDRRASMVRLALVLEKQQQFAEAEQLFREAMEDERTAPYRSAVTKVRIARCVAAQGRHEEAASLFTDAHRMVRNLGPQQVSGKTELLVSYARYLMSLDRMDDAGAKLQLAQDGLSDTAPNAQWSRWAVAAAQAEYSAAKNDAVMEQVWRQRAAEAFAWNPQTNVCEE